MRKRIKSLIVTAVATVMAITSLSAVGIVSRNTAYAASGGANGSSDGIGHNSGASGSGQGTASGNSVQRSGGGWKISLVYTGQGLYAPEDESTQPLYGVNGITPLSISGASGVPSGYLDNGSMTGRYGIGAVYFICDPDKAEYSLSSDLVSEERNKIYNYTYNSPQEVLEAINNNLAEGLWEFSGQGNGYNYTTEDVANDIWNAFGEQCNLFDSATQINNYLKTDNIAENITTKEQINRNTDMAYAMISLMKFRHRDNGEVSSTINEILNRVKDNTGEFMILVEPMGYIRYKGEYMFITPNTYAMATSPLDGNTYTILSQNIDNLYNNYWRFNIAGNYDLYADIYTYFRGSVASDNRNIITGSLPTGLYGSGAVPTSQRLSVRQSYFSKAIYSGPIKWENGRLAYDDGNDTAYAGYYGKWGWTSFASTDLLKKSSGKKVMLNVISSVVTTNDQTPVYSVSFQGDYNELGDALLTDYSNKVNDIITSIVSNEDDRLTDYVNGGEIPTDDAIVKSIVDKILDDNDITIEGENGEQVYIADLFKTETDNYQKLCGIVAGMLQTTLSGGTLDDTSVSSIKNLILYATAQSGINNIPVASINQLDSRLKITSGGGYKYLGVTPESNINVGKKVIIGSILAQGLSNDTVESDSTLSSLKVDTTAVPSEISSVVENVSEKLYWITSLTADAAKELVNKDITYTDNAGETISVSGDIKGNISEVTNLVKIFNVNSDLSIRGLYSIGYDTVGNPIRVALDRSGEKTQTNTVQTVKGGFDAESKEIQQLITRYLADSEIFIKKSIGNTSYEEINQRLSRELQWRIATYLDIIEDRRVGVTYSTVNSTERLSSGITVDGIKLPTSKVLCYIDSANAEQFGAEPVLGQNYTYKVYSSTTGFDSDARAMVNQMVYGAWDNTANTQEKVNSLVSATTTDLGASALRYADTLGGSEELANLIPSFYSKKADDNYTQIINVVNPTNDIAYCTTNGTNNFVLEMNSNKYMGLMKCIMATSVNTKNKTAVAITNTDGSYTAYYPASSTVKTYFFTTGLIGVPYEESKVEIEKTKICLRFIIVYDILIVLVIANSVISILYTAITKAIDYCIEENIMREFLIKHKAEVFSVCITEFDEKIYEAELREEAREEGLKEGREGERAKNILTTVSILRGLGLDDSTIVQQISEKFELTPLEIDRYFDKVLKGLDRSNSKC